MILETRFEEIERVLNDREHNLVDSYQECSSGLILVRLKNKITFSVDCLRRHERARVTLALRETNPLQQLLSARNLGYREFTEGINSGVSRQLISNLCQGFAPLSRNTQALLYEYTGLEFDPADFNHKNILEMKGTL